MHDQPGPSASRRAACPIQQRGGQVLNRLPLPQVQQAERDLVLVTRVGDRSFVAQVAAQDRNLLLRREKPT